MGEEEVYISKISDAFFSKLHNKDDWGKWAPYFLKLGSSLVKLEKKTHKFSLGIITPCLDYSAIFLGIGYIIEKNRLKEESKNSSLDYLKTIPTGTPVQFTLDNKVMEKGIFHGIKTNVQTGIKDTGIPPYLIQIEVNEKKKEGIKKRIHNISPKYASRIKILKQTKKIGNLNDVQKNNESNLIFSKRTKVKNSIIDQIIPNNQLNNMYSNSKVFWEFFVTRKKFEKELKIPFGEYHNSTLNDLLMVEGIPPTNQPSKKSRIFSENNDGEDDSLSIFSRSQNFYRFDAFKSPSNNLVLLGLSDKWLRDATELFSNQYLSRDENEKINTELLPPNYWDLQIMGFYQRIYE